MVKPKLYIKTGSETYPGTRILKEDYPQFEGLEDFRESWSGRKFEWDGERVLVQGDTIVKGAEPLRVLHVVPVEIHAAS